MVKRIEDLSLGEALAKLRRIRSLTYPVVGSYFMEEALMLVQMEFGDEEYRERCREILWRRFQTAQSDLKACDGALSEDVD